LSADLSGCPELPNYELHERLHAELQRCARLRALMYGRARLHQEQLKTLQAITSGDLMLSFALIALLNAAPSPDAPPPPPPPPLEPPVRIYLLPHAHLVEPAAREGLTFAKVAWRIGGVWAGLP